MNNFDPEAQSGGPAATPAEPATPAVRPGWTGGRVTALVIGSILILISLGLLGGGATVLWVDLAHRDATGYVTSGVHHYSSAGSALTTERIDLGSPGMGRVYGPAPLDKVRIRVTPASSGVPVFVGIAPSADVDRYLAGVKQTRISDFWTDRVTTIEGGTPASAPGAQSFWVVSSTGTGTRTVEWIPASGSWTVVVMNADGRSGVDVGTDFGARVPALLWIAVGLLVAGAVFAVGGALLIAGAIRRASRTITA